MSCSAAMPATFNHNIVVCHCRDDSEGSDNWAVASGWVSVTPLLLRQDVPLRLVSAAPVPAAAFETSEPLVEGRSMWKPCVLHYCQ
jgi:hypothetical protein